MERHDSGGTERWKDRIVMGLGGRRRGVAVERGGGRRGVAVEWGGGRTG